MKKNLNIVVMCVLVCALTACSTFEKNAYATLESVQAVYDAGMATAADMKVNGDLSDENWDSIAEASVKLSAVGATASKAMKIYTSLPDESNMEKAKAAILAVYNEAEFFVENVEKLTGKELPIALKLFL